MNEKDTIIKLQGEVIEGLKKELGVVRYCADKLVVECKKLEKVYKHNSRCYYVMGIGTGLLISSVLDYCFSKKKERIHQFHSKDADISLRLMVYLSI